jgi:hypothetical protein
MIVHNEGLLRREQTSFMLRERRFPIGTILEFEAAEVSEIVDGQLTPRKIMAEGTLVGYGRIRKPGKYYEEFATSPDYVVVNRNKNGVPDGLDRVLSLDYIEKEVALVLDIPEVAETIPKGFLDLESQPDIML